MLDGIIALLIGSAVFITGMNMMSSGLKKATGKGLRRLFKKTQNNVFACTGIGAAVTALIQSSAATSVMAIGFIGAGAMTVFQASAIIFGAYLGTTVTGVLASLSSFNFSKYFVLLAFVGVILMFFKKEKIKNIGEICTGLGLLFFGLSTMSGALKPVDGQPNELLNAVQAIFSNNIIQFPVFLLVVGALFTALVQSSSATTGVVIVLLGQGAISIQSGFYLVIGATIGTLITMFIATIGNSTNAKRTMFISFVIRVICAIIGTVLVAIFGNYIADFLISVFKTNELALAMFLVLYNVFFLIFVLPTLRLFEKLSIKVIKDKDLEKKKNALKFIDSHLLNTPAIAMMQVKFEIENMMQKSLINFQFGYNRLMKLDESNDSQLIDNEDTIDYMNNKISDFLIELTHRVSMEDEKIVGSYFHVVNDIERIGDHAYNFYELALKMKENDLEFSQIATQEIDEMNKVIIDMFNISFDIFNTQDKTKLAELHRLEDITDKMKTTLSAKHFERITRNECKNELSPFYSSLVSELERVADHLVNIGYSIVNPTGDADEK